MPKWAEIEKRNRQAPANGWDSPTLRRAAFLLTNAAMRADAETAASLRRVRSLVVHADEETSREGEA